MVIQLGRMEALTVLEFPEYYSMETQGMDENGKNLSLDDIEGDLKEWGINRWRGLAEDLVRMGENLGWVKENKSYRRDSDNEWYNSVLKYQLQLHGTSPHMTINSRCMPLWHAWVY